MGRQAPALQDARLLPGLRLLEPLPDPELPLKRGGAEALAALAAHPPLRALPAEGPAAASGRRRAEGLTHPNCIKFSTCQTENLMQFAFCSAWAGVCPSVRRSRRRGRVCT